MPVRTLTHNKAGSGHIFKPLKDKKEFVDALLCSEFSTDDIIYGHRIVLAGVSSILKRHFLKTPNINDKIVIKKIDHATIEKILDLIYSGKIVVPENDWDDFSDACRMINLRLGTQTDKILYEIESDEDEEKENDEKEKEEDDKKVKSPINIKKELNADMIPTSSNVPFEAPTRPRPSEDFDLPFADHKKVPSSGVISCVSGIKHKKRAKLEPTPPQPQPKLKIEPTTIQSSSDESSTSSENSLVKGSNGLYNIIVENIINPEKLNFVRDICSKSGNLMDFMHITDVFYAGYKTEIEAKKTIKMLERNDNPACRHTIYIPQDSHSVDVSVSPPPCLDMPPPPLLSMPPPPLPSKVAFGGFGQSPPQVPFTSQPPPPVPFAAPNRVPAGRVAQEDMNFVSQPPPPVPFVNQPPPSFLTKPPPLAAFVSQPPPPFVTQPPPQKSSFGTQQPNMELFSNPANLAPGGRLSQEDRDFGGNPRNNRMPDRRLPAGPPGADRRPLGGPPAADRRPPAGPSIQVYIGNLPNKTNEKWLTKFLNKDYKKLSYIKGSIRIFETSAKLAPTRNKTYAFVNCSTRADAQHFIKSLHQKPCRNRVLVVKDAEEGKKKKQMTQAVADGVLGSSPMEGDEEESGGNGVQPQDEQMDRRPPNGPALASQGFPQWPVTAEGFQRRDARGSSGRGRIEGGESDWDWKRSRGRQDEDEDGWERGKFQRREGGFEQPPPPGLEEEERFRRGDAGQNTVSVCEPDTSQPTLQDDEDDEEYSINEEY